MSRFASSFIVNEKKPCRAIAPIYEKVRKKYVGRLLFATLDVDDHPEMPGYPGIQGFPTFMLFKAGKEIGRLIGPHPARLKNAIDRVPTENGLFKEESI